MLPRLDPLLTQIHIGLQILDSRHVIARRIVRE